MNEFNFSCSFQKYFILLSKMNSFNLLEYNKIKYFFNTYSKINEIFNLLNIYILKIIYGH